MPEKEQGPQTEARPATPGEKKKAPPISHETINEACRKTEAMIGGGTISYGARQKPGAEGYVVDYETPDGDLKRLKSGLDREGILTLLHGIELGYAIGFQRCDAQWEAGDTPVDLKPARPDGPY